MKTHQISATLISMHEADLRESLISLRRGEREREDQTNEYALDKIVIKERMS